MPNDPKASTANRKAVLRINFVLPPSPTISGGPLAILEYANRLIERGHTVSVTTYPDSLWSGDSPFPWFRFNGPVHYVRQRHLISQQPDSKQTSPIKRTIQVIRLLLQNVGNNQKMQRLAQELRDDDSEQTYDTALAILLEKGGISELVKFCMNPGKNLNLKPPLEFFFNEFFSWQYIMQAMPDCDLNIATLWTTVFPVYFSKKGKPVFFMQHLDEVFYPFDNNHMLLRIFTRSAYSLPIYKVANSSWLQQKVHQRCKQLVPFSNNAMEVSDFNPMPKTSARDGILRVLTYSRPEDWKGFGDAVAAMHRIRIKYREKVQWNVFGYQNPELPPDNSFAPYTYHPKLSFKQLAELYATSDIVLCPSWYESFPLPPLEGMASGTAVVTTDQGTEDYAKHEQNALVIKTRAIDEMVAAIDRLITDPALRERLAKAGRRTAESYTWERAVDNRERILLAIHNNEQEYDLFDSARTGLDDGFGRAVETAPADLPFRGPLLVRESRGAVYLIERGAKRHVTHPDLLGLPQFKDRDILDIDRLTAYRIPTGPAIFSGADIAVHIPASYDTRGLELIENPNGDRYLIEQGRKRALTDKAVLEQDRFKNLPVQRLEYEALFLIPTGPPITAADEAGAAAP